MQDISPSSQVAAQYQEYLLVVTIVSFQVGFWIWEYVSTISFDIEILSGRHSLRLRTFLYLLLRVFATLFVLMVALFRQNFVRVQCGVIWRLSNIFGTATLVACQAQFALRAMTAWNYHPAVVGILSTGMAAFLVVGMCLGQGPAFRELYDEHTGWACVPTNNRQKLFLIHFFFSIAIDVLTAALTVYKLFAAAKRTHVRLLSLAVRDAWLLGLTPMIPTAACIVLVFIWDATAAVLTAIPIDITIHAVLTSRCYVAIFQEGRSMLPHETALRAQVLNGEILDPQSLKRLAFNATAATPTEERSAAGPETKAELSQRADRWLPGAMSKEQPDSAAPFASYFIQPPAHVLCEDEEHDIEDPSAKWGRHLSGGGTAPVGDSMAMQTLHRTDSGGGAGNTVAGPSQSVFYSTAPLTRIPSGGLHEQLHADSKKQATHGTSLFSDRKGGTGAISRPANASLKSKRAQRSLFGRRLRGSTSLLFGSATLHEQRARTPPLRLERSESKASSATPSSSSCVHSMSTGTGTLSSAPPHLLRLERSPSNVGLPVEVLVGVDVDVRVEYKEAHPLPEIFERLRATPACGPSCPQSKKRGRARSSSLETVIDESGDKARRVRSIPSLRSRKSSASLASAAGGGAGGSDRGGAKGKGVSTHGSKLGTGGRFGFRRSPRASTEGSMSPAPDGGDDSDSLLAVRPADEGTEPGTVTDAPAATSRATRDGPGAAADRPPLSPNARFFHASQVEQTDHEETETILSPTSSSGAAPTSSSARMGRQSGRWHHRAESSGVFARRHSVLADAADSQGADRGPDDAEEDNTDAASFTTARTAPFFSPGIAPGGIVGATGAGTSTEGSRSGSSHRHSTGAPLSVRSSVSSLAGLGASTMRWKALGRPSS